MKPNTRDTPCLHPEKDQHYEIRTNEYVCRCGMRRQVMPDVDWYRPEGAVDQRPEPSA